MDIEETGERTECADHENGVAVDELQGLSRKRPFHRG